MPQRLAHLGDREKVECLQNRSPIVLSNKHGFIPFAANGDRTVRFGSLVDEGAKTLPSLAYGESHARVVRDVIRVCKRASLR